MATFVSATVATGDTSVTVPVYGNAVAAIQCPSLSGVGVGLQGSLDGTSFTAITRLVTGIKFDAESLPDTTAEEFLKPVTVPAYSGTLPGCQLFDPPMQGLQSIKILLSGAQSSPTTFVLSLI